MTFLYFKNYFAGGSSTKSANRKLDGPERADLCDKSSLRFFFVVPFSLSLSFGHAKESEREFKPLQR